MNSPSRPAVGARGAAEAARAAALVVEGAAVARQLPFVGATCAVCRRYVGRETRARVARLTVHG
jgi:hypothetical protein